MNPLKFYVILHSVEGIKSGVYLYNPENHSLIEHKEHFNPSDYKYISVWEDMARDIAFSIYITASLDLTGLKYGSRGYRFATLEAGHAAQNLSLVANGLGLGAVASGGFYDKGLFNYLDIDDDNNYLLYEIFVGTPSDETLTGDLLF